MISINMLFKELYLDKATFFWKESGQKDEFNGWSGMVVFRN